MNKDLKFVTVITGAVAAVLSAILASPFVDVLPANVGALLTVLFIAVTVIGHVASEAPSELAKSKLALDEFRHGQVVSGVRELASELSNFVAAIKPAMEAVAASKSPELAKVEPVVADAEKVAADVHAASTAVETVDSVAAAADTVVQEAAPVVEHVVPAATPALSAAEQAAADVERVLGSLKQG